MRVSFLAFVVCVAATVLQPLVRIPVISPASIGQAFQRRQISIGSQSSVPSQCTSTCDPVNNEISFGCPFTECCTTTFENEYFNCLQCVGTAIDATSYTTAQNNLNLLYTTCVDMGFVLPPLALPGQNASSTASTGSEVSVGPTGLPSTRANGAIRRRGVQAVLLPVLLWLARLW